MFQTQKNNTPDFLLNQNNFMFFNNNANIPAPLPSNKLPHKNKINNSNNSYINNPYNNNNNNNNYIDENIINSLLLINNSNNNLNYNNDYNVPTSPQINNVDLYSSSQNVQTINIKNSNNSINTPITTTNNFPQYCSLKKCELCKRGQPPLLLKTPTWSSIMRVVFFTLHNEYPEKEYFSLKTEVYEFMTSHWEKLCINRKRTDNWRKQIQDMLSHSKNVFESGLEKLKQNGFWKLRNIVDPWVIQIDSQSVNSSSSSSSPSMASNNSSPWRKKRSLEEFNENECGSNNNNNNNNSGDKKLRYSNESISTVPSSPLNADQSTPELESIDQIFSKEIQSIRSETQKIFKLLPTIKKDNEKLKTIQQTLSLFETRLNHLEKEKENIKISSPSLSLPSSPLQLSEPSSPLQQIPCSPSQPNSRSNSPLPLQRISNNCTNSNNNNNNSNQKLFFI